MEQGERGDWTLVMVERSWKGGPVIRKWDVRGLPSISGGVDCEKMQKVF